MDNNEIRLRILCEFYDVLFKKDDQHPERLHKKLKISMEEENAAYVWLIDKNLLEGIIEYPGSYVLASPNRITAHGMDIVENIVDDTFKKLKENKIEVIELESKKDKFFKFMKKCLTETVPDMACKYAIESGTVWLDSLK